MLALENMAIYHHRRITNRTNTTMQKRSPIEPSTRQQELQHNMEKISFEAFYKTKIKITTFFRGGNIKKQLENREI